MKKMQIISPGNPEDLFYIASISSGKPDELYIIVTSIREITNG